ncbi:mucin TcMUCII [Trypanosoma cruzi cruzi]|uniref:Putative mucin TcMUCII n=1 Tax=Trypanosoma cruzi TaxID=5693 RepID=A0A2V2W3X7_TRYCR|nr:mucin TcMUCII [Trypanosoma cruzi cruzi]PBJ77725.1 mucin TcMUCII [Trypanosoma cruzi cruzi]PWU86598.1 putative mucin TcMUCII [Trypanosoma cruzi]PWV03231.1 putative mucin TcMUCII [Trypanosoma cruzi]
MMTCRLLCALLVLALCCCPSVCVTAAGSGVKEERSEKGSDLEDNQVEEPKQLTELPIKASSSPETKKEKKGTEHAGNTVLHTSQTTGTMQETAEPQSNLNKTKEKDDGKSTEERTENTNADNANEQNEKPNAMNTTTTTTTQAPSTTTTEAPTTTTTRAPSRLREIDGSLSSSAWVCAPLLLSASALAYTTVG